LIGRENEVSVINKHLEETTSGKGSILLIGGEPGVGKTRLGEEAIAWGYRQGLLPLIGHAYEERGTPFVTSAEILEDVARILPPDMLKNALGNTAAEIALLLPDLRRQFPEIPEPAALPPGQQQRFLFNAVLEFLTRLSRSCPLVLMLDDLHWADDSSILLLEHLAPHLQRLPILMVVTYRDVESDMSAPFKRALAQLSRQSYAKLIPVQRFSRDDVVSLLTTMGAPDPPPQMVDAIFHETNGNAFFVQSVFRHLSDEDRLFDTEGQWLSSLDTESLAVPDSVRLVTSRRIAKLSRPTQELLAIAAVLGLRFRLNVLEAAAPERESMVDSIEEADAAQLIRQSIGGRNLRYEFVHALARQNLLSSLSAPRQQQQHLKNAEAIQASYRKNPDRRAADLAYHLVEAGNLADPKQVIHWSAVAGNNAMKTAAFEEAAHYFSTAIAELGDEMVNEGADEAKEQKADLLHTRGAAQLSLGRKDSFLEDLEAAYDQYAELRLGEKAARVAADISYIHVWNGEPDRVYDQVTRALQLLGDEETPGRCQLLSAHGMAHTMGREPADAERSHDAAVKLARKLGGEQLLADILQNQALSNWQRLGGEIQEQPAHEAAAMRRKAHQEWNLGHCLWMEKSGLVFQGRFDEAERIDQELTPIAERNEDFGSMGCQALMSSTIAQARGDL
jgi:DNA polymerase III delta prime subunit